MKEKVDITKCTDEDILAEDIINQYGAVILPSGTVINKYIIQKLSDMGIEKVLIFSNKKYNEHVCYNYQLIEKKYENSLNEIKRMVLEVVKGEKIDYSAISNLTNSIISICEEQKHIIRCLTKIRDTDDYTYYHSMNVSFYSMLLAIWLNLSREDIKIVIQAGLLHDLGKAKISNDLLNKKEKLSAQEFEKIKRHTIHGYEMVKDSEEIANEVKDVILMHHEREDKSGYPLNSGGDELSIYTKIVAVADVYDAMTSNRSYKSAMTPFDAFEELMTVCRGSLDIHIVDTLLSNLSRYLTGSSVLLTNGLSGIIAYVPPHSMWRPIIDTETGLLDLSREMEINITRMI